MPAGPNPAWWRAAGIWAWLLVAGAPVPLTSQTNGGHEGWQIPLDAATELNPVPMNPVELAKGRSLYRSKCQRCHGVEGKGNGPDADPNHAPSDLTDGRRASRNPDGVMFYKIWNGRSKPKMPAMKSDMSRIDVWTVILYVKTLSAPASK